MKAQNVIEFCEEKHLLCIFCYGKVNSEAGTSTDPPPTKKQQQQI